jgi:hypothetical protein
MKRKGNPSEVLYMSCTSRLRWIDVFGMALVRLIQHSKHKSKPETAFWVSNMGPNLGTPAGTYSGCRAALPLLSPVLEPPGGFKFRAPNHAAANQMTIHYVIKKIKSNAC